MSTLNSAYASIANMNLWLKLQAGEELLLSDVPSIIPLRWGYFRDNWEFLKPSLQKKVAAYLEPDSFNQQIKNFSSFIDSQRNVRPGINPFSNSSIFYTYYAIFDNILIKSISLTNEEQRLIANISTTIKNYSKNDFLFIKKNITDYRDRMSDINNLNDSTYDTVTDRSALPAQVDATVTELNSLISLQNAIAAVDFILANLFAVDAALDPFALARANANNPEVNIGQYKSGTLVRMNYGENLESLAYRYLGDPDKWIDIAIANGLKPPYIDEVGTHIPLLANGNGFQVNLPAIDAAGVLNIDRFYINQPVCLQSSTQPAPDQRTITSLRQIPISGEILLELDGENDLEQYKIADGASVLVYQPNTINSGFYILIPNSTPLSDDRKDDVPWFLVKSAEDEKRAKIDLAIDDLGDLNFTTNNDLQLSYGLDNAIQAMKLKMITELGTLRYHPDYGLVNVVGETNRDLDSVRELIIDSITSQVTEDERYDRIESLDVTYMVGSASSNAVTAMGINLSVRLAGGTRVVPISFTVNMT